MDEDGRVITANRFVAHKGYFPQGWLLARRGGVTATQVAKAATKAGLEQAVTDYIDDTQIPDNPYMAFGRDFEPVIARTVHTKFDILPNEWLIKTMSHHTIWLRLMACHPITR